VRSGVDATTLALYNSQRFDSHSRIKVMNASGSMITVTDRCKGYRLEAPNPNLPIGALTLEFVRETDLAHSLAPFVTASLYNRADNGISYYPLLQIGTLVTKELALTAEGALPDGSSTWYEVFRGTISSVDWPSYAGRTATAVCTDIAGLLQKSKSETAYTYVHGTAIETAIQQVLTNNGYGWLPFSCPVATGKVLPNDYAPGIQKTVWEQVWSLAQSMGWLLWIRYTGTSTFALTLFEPPRDKTVPDQSFGFVHDYGSFGIQETDIGNVLYVRYYDGGGIQQQVGPLEDLASITTYGGPTALRRPRWIVLNPDSPVRDSSSATALGLKALSDIADPDVLATVTLPPTWFAEAGVDLFTFPPLNGKLFDTTRDAAPFAITYNRQGIKQPEASMSLRGKPSSGSKTWEIVGGGAIITSGTGSLSDLVLPDVIDTFLIGDAVPYVSAGGATDAWPKRPFTVHTQSASDTWSLGGLFLEDVPNVSAFGPQGFENYLRFQNTNTIAGPNLGIISNAELQGASGILGHLTLYTGGLVINSNGGGVTGDVVVFDGGGVQRVTGATSTVSGKVIGFKGQVPATHAAVTGESWNLYMSGTAQNYLGARTYFGSTTDTTYLERSGAGELNTGARLNTGGGYAIGGSTVLTSTQILQNVTFSAGLNVALLNATTPFTAVQSIESPAANGALRFRVSTDTQYRWLKRVSGAEEWGAGGSSTADIFISRSTTGTYQIKAAAASALTFELASNNVIGGAGASVLLVMRDQGNQAFTFTGNFGAASGSRDLQLISRLDRDGNKLPWSFWSLNASGTATRALSILAGSDAGKVAFSDKALFGPAATVSLERTTISGAETIRCSGALDAVGGFYTNGTQVVTPTGTLAPGSVANAAAFAAGLKPVEVWTYATLPNPGTADQIAFVTDWPLGGGVTAPRMARRVSAGVWTALAAASEIVGQITAGSIAAGAVTASAINVSALSAISANVGTVNAGVLQNAAGTRYIDLSAGTANFLQHEKLSLLHSGGALFTGTVKLLATTGNTLEFWNGATNIANITTTHYTAGSGFDAINYEFPSISRSLAFSAQSGYIWIQNLNSSGVENSSIQMGADTTIVGTTSLNLGGSGTSLGFFGLSPVTRRTVTGSKASGAALASLLLALVNYGLIVDNSTA